MKTHSGRVAWRIPQAEEPGRLQSVHGVVKSCTILSDRMEKTRDLFKEIRDTKAAFHAKMGSIKDRNGMDLTEAEDIKRGGKNTQNYAKKVLMTQVTSTV